MTNQSPEAAPDRVIVISRVFDAPRELVFAAFTDPEHAGHWWGPNGFTITTREVAVRPGGKWKFVMHGPDGTDYENTIVYHEIVKPERLVYAHSGTGADEPGQFVTTVTFDEQAGKTKLTMRAVFRSKEDRDYVIKHHGAIEGGKQMLERLGKHLETMGTGSAADASDREIISKRIIAASRDLVFRAFSDPDQLARWWGPKGFTSTFKTFDFRPGGTWRFTMHGPDGADYQNEHNFTEVVPLERIVYRHVQPPAHSFTMTITFAEQKGKTELVWCMCFESVAEAAKLKSFIAGANEQNFDRLEAHLASLN